jgi:predicted alpha/beta superfamily hydrolase
LLFAEGKTITFTKNDIMKKYYFFLLLPLISVAQVTLKVTALPSNTPVGASVYFAGSANSWNPGNAAYVLQPDGLGNIQITIPEGTGTVEYKFTRGSWPTVEGNATGGYLPNRTFTFTGSPQTISLTIQSWEDLGGTSGSTAASNVQIMSPGFYMPQLDRYRRIWIYLPPDYNTSTKHYPVLYMQDGQNLFDNATSFSGEWQIDETLNTLFANGDYGAIVVGIDNGGSERLNEYSPWVNPSYGGGLGDEYVAFLANTLKPYIDTNYRTRPEPAMTALIGSSMGGLISTYGSTEFSGIFRKVGSLSPAYWFAWNDLMSYIANGNFSLENHRIYFVAGTNESSGIVSEINQVKNALMAKGLAAENVLTKFDSYGVHNENYWRGEFAALYQWLFANENLAIAGYDVDRVSIFQAPSGKIYVQGLDAPTTFDIISYTGRQVGTIVLSNGISELPSGLPRSVYILMARSKVAKPVKIFKN